MTKKPPRANSFPTKPQSPATDSDIKTTQNINLGITAEVSDKIEKMVKTLILDAENLDKPNNREKFVLSAQNLRSELCKFRSLFQKNVEKHNELYLQKSINVSKKHTF
jgi:hypothetical protein